MNLQYLNNQEKIKNLYLKKDIISIYTPKNVEIDKKEKDNFIINLNKSLGNHFVVAKTSKPINDFIINLLNITSKEYHLNKKKYLKYVYNIAYNLKKIDKNIFLNRFIENTFFEQSLIIRDVQFAPEDYFLTKANSIKIYIKSSNYIKTEFFQDTYKSTKFDYCIDLDKDIDFDRLSENIVKLLERRKTDKNKPINKTRKRKKFSVFHNGIMINNDLTKKELNEFLNKNQKKKLTYEQCN